MEYFTGSTSDLDAITDPKLVVARAPHMAERFDAIKEVRNSDPDGRLYRGSDWRHVASFVSVPLMTVAELVEPGLLQDKRRFYRWLDSHKEYCVYDRRRGAKRGDLVTFVDGKEI